ncbi:MAG: hypothetical protein A2748_02215 [Candidatus Wildermuthbacteria bacterium RIFCSPHIGHO2_01_FULL_45_20]|uniref:Metal ABC transporter permease n=1 Tax=Candidatus Wildermuthbacteria bacterium RIFCSPHIGHO2_02_FULL_45_25 TaxID=1802450 RepID=A0A1G2QYM4_9BACT|nr:MAG: hypothetical protein A2748_02215 [Candidatus Wildermuthbacteria bacterium RIFCSPHIGHO2_01_FULL_45_20]OHA65734.1 MAG: hypothetical protein A3C04_02355 [Candidatus Wildermuthbacteria bacterium RIFCSPHIGHO2_02_FULL_45_25]
MEFLTLAFMQRALLAGIAIGLILPFLGVFVSMRRMAFFGDGIAHASLAGIALGIVTGANPFWGALAVGIAFGIGVYALEHKTNLSSDVVIGVLFTSGLALGVVLMSFQHGYQPDLITFLFGNILAISQTDMLVIAGLAAVIFSVLFWYARHFTMIAFDRETAWTSGMNTELLNLLFYILLSVTIVLGVKLLGIILVSALLIIPAAIGKLLAPSFIGLVTLSIIAGEFAIGIGLLISYYLDIPSGSTIILTGSGMLILAVLGRSIVRKIL